MMDMLEAAISHKARIENNKKDYDENCSRIRVLSSELSVVNEIFRTTDLAFEYLERVVGDESTKFIRRIQGLLDYAVKTIFFDKQYSIDISVEDSNTVIYLTYDDEDGNKIKANIKEAVGGGVRSICGLVLSIFFINHYRSYKVLFMDEALSQISSIYVPYVMGFISEIAEKMEFKFLLITHDERFKPYADKTYRVENGKSTLIYEKGDIEVSNDDTVGISDI